MQQPSQNLSLENLSPIRKKSLKIFFRLNSVSDKYVKHPTLKALVMHFVKPHIQNVISREVPEDELKQILWECYNEIDELKSQMDVVKEIKFTPTDKILNEKVKELPAFKALADIL